MDFISINDKFRAEKIICYVFPAFSYIFKWPLIIRLYVLILIKYICMYKYNVIYHETTEL